MRPKPTEADGRRALKDHVMERAAIARDRYPGPLDGATLRTLLADHEIVRYPTTLAFASEVLEPGEFAYAQPLGPHPKDGFRLCVHPYFQSRDDDLPLLVAYHIVTINYGDIATYEEAEFFGATLLGLDVESYYQALCTLADELSANVAPGPCPPDSRASRSPCTRS